MSAQTELDIAAKVLELVATRAGASTEVEVEVNRNAQALTRFANSFIHQNVADDTTKVRVRVHAAGRTAAAATTRTDPAGLQGLVERVVDAVAVAPADPGWPGLAPPSPLAGEPGFDEPTAAAAGQQRAGQVRAFIDGAGNLPAAGYCRTRHWHAAFANSAGQAITSAGTEAAMDGIARLGGSDGVARLSSTRLADLDSAVLGARAAAKAHAGTDPVELPPGRYEVVLEPNAVADLLTNFAFSGFNGRAYAERRSFAELGAEQFDAAVTIVDDPFAPGCPGTGFDSEGTPKRRLPLVEAGVTTAVTYDRRTAALAGGGSASTGHAQQELQGMGFGPVAANPALLPGPGEPAPATATVADPAAVSLIAGVARGLLVTDLWYTRVLDPKSLVVTGLTRNGVWLIEDGQVTTPVQNLRFTQSYPQALGPGAVTAIGPAAVVIPTGWLMGWRTAPALHLASWNFTGGASG
jgi:predicted Zn-dependent protease